MLDKLRQARALFDEPTYSQQAESSRQPTRFAKELEELPLTRPTSVASVTSVVGGVVDGVGSVGSFLKSKTRGSYVSGSMFSDWGWGARRTSAG
jgi:sorting nexin-9/18/33